MRKAEQPPDEKEKEVKDQARKYDEIIRQQKDHLRMLRGGLDSDGRTSTGDKRSEIISRQRVSGSGMQEARIGRKEISRGSGRSS